MKQAWNSFFRTCFQFMKQQAETLADGLRKKTAVLTVAVTVMTVVLSAAAEGTGASLVAFAETVQASEQTERVTEETKEESWPADESAGTKDEAEKARERLMAQKKGPGFVDTKKDETEAAPLEKKNEEVQAEAPKQEAEEKAAPANAAAVKLSEKDYNVLLKIVQAEAGNCDTKGRILVANVVMNRVNDSRFPNNVTDVVYAKSQFSPVSNGSINRCKVTAQTIEAVDRALAGEDYSQGALYFMNRSASSGRNVSWFDRELTYLFRHGSHEFFR